MTPKLGLDPATVREVRELARKAGEPITEMARTHATVRGAGRVSGWPDCGAPTRTECRGSTASPTR